MVKIALLRTSRRISTLAAVIAVMSTAFNGAASEPRELELAEYAPIRYPFIVSWFYFGDAPSVSDTHDSDYLNTLTSNHGTFNAWADDGVLPLQHIGWRYATQDRMKSRAEAGQAGVVFDELLKTDEDVPENCDRFQDIIEVKQEYPDYYVGVHGNTVTPSLVKAVNSGAVEHFYEESYTSSYYNTPEYAVSPAGIRHRWKMYRAAGIIDRVVWHFGCLEEEPDNYFHQGFTPTRLEYEMQLARRWAPEKAGVCFYTLSVRRPDSPLFEAIDRLVYEYYLRPAPDVDLEIEQSEDLQVEVRIISGDSEFGGRPVEWKGFLDTRQVAESDSFTVDFRDRPDGDYRITGHATTEDHYHGAAQYLLTLKNGTVRDITKVTDDRPEREPVERLDSPGGTEPVHALAVRDEVVFMGVDSSLRILEFGDRWKRISTFAEFPELELPDQPERFALKDDVLYAACGEDGVAVVDISDLANPQLISTYDKVSRAEDVYARADLLLVAAGGDGLVLLDAGDKAHLTELGRVSFDYAWGVAAEKGLACVAAGMEGMAVVDIENPRDPKNTALLETGNSALKVDMKDDVAVVADWKGGVRVVDVADSDDPREIGRHRLPWVWDVKIKDNIVYVADENFGLRAFDLEDPEALAEDGGQWSKASVVIWDRSETGDALSVAVEGDNVFTVDGWVGLRGFDMAEGLHEKQNLSQRGNILHPIKSVWNVWIKGVRPWE